MSLLHRIKYKFSEPYRIRIGVGLSPLRNEREYNALIEFCKKELARSESLRYNRTRKKVYEATIKLHELETPEGFWFKLPYCRKMYYNNVNEFINDHVSWYWD